MIGLMVCGRIQYIGAAFNTLLLLYNKEITQTIDTSTWSLVYEMRISLIFPLLIYLGETIKYKWLTLSSTIMMVCIYIIGKKPLMPSTINYTFYYSFSLYLGLS